jgi:hypothetical protein
MIDAGSELGISDLRFSFPRGVDPSVKAALEDMGLTVEGPIVRVHGPDTSDADNDDGGAP